MTRGPTPSFLIGPISCRRAWPRRPALGATKTTRRPRICMGKTKNVLAAAKRLVRTARTMGRLWFGRRAHRRPVGALKLAPSPPRGAPPGATRAAPVVPRRRRLGAWAHGRWWGGASDPGRPVRRCAGCAVASARARTGGSQRRAWMMRVRALRLGVRPRAHGRVPAARLDDAGAVGSRGDARIAPWVQCYDGQLQAFSSRERGNGKERSSPSSKRGWKCE